MGNICGSPSTEMTSDITPVDRKNKPVMSGGQVSNNQS